MSWLTRTPGPVRGQGLRRTLAIVLVLSCTACALPPPAPGPAGPAPGASVADTCAHWYLRLDDAIEHAGVRDAAAAPVPGHPFLRVDRFHASLRDHLPHPADAPTAAAVRAALLERLLALDLQARRHEIANLPQQARDDLATLAQRPAAADDLLQHTRACGQVLVQAALARAARTHALLQDLSVAPDYESAYRFLGLYPLTRIPFLHGVRRFEDSIRNAFRQDPPPDADAPQQWLVPPWRPAPEQVTRERLRAMLQPAADDPLGIPAPTPAQQDILFAHFAPAFVLGIRSDDDRTGALHWPAQPPRGTPRPDIARPVVYRQLAWTRHGQASLLQLVYTIWFGARTPTSWPIDLLAGRLDGLVWRVTLSSDGVPLMYDSIHPCGCYHQFFPPSWVRPRPAPDPHAEWAFSPAPAPDTAPGQYLVLRVAPVTHYLTRLQARAPSSDGTPYAWQDYDRLRSLPTPEGAHRSVFDARGFIPGTDRAEAWLFWPMGIARAGTMRQWGRHATAFVGRRHFDDARLIDERFVLDAPPRDD